MANRAQRCVVAILFTVAIAGCGSTSVTPSPGGPSPSVPPVASPSPSPTTPGSAVPATTPSPAPATASYAPPQSILAASHPPVAMSAVVAAVDAAIAGGGDPASPGLAAAIPRLLEDCRKPPEPYAMDAGYRCLFLVVATYHVYLDTRDETWYQAALSALNYTWNARFTTTTKAYRGLLAPALAAGSGTVEQFVQGAVRSIAGQLLAPSVLGGPVPDRKPLVDVSHPKTTIASVAARVSAALTDTPPPNRGAISASLRACRTKVREYDRDAGDTASSGCVNLAANAYIVYLQTGSEAWYRAAKAAADYQWTHQYLTPNWGNAFLEPETLRYDLRERLRYALIDQVPGYIGQAP